MFTGIVEELGEIVAKEGQTVGGQTFPFSDHDEVRKALRERAT